MKILHIASADFAGVAIKMVKAIQRYSNHEARLVTGRKHSFGFKTDIVAHRSVATVKKWVAWADIVNTYDHYGMLQRAGLRPDRLIITYHGSRYRRSWKECNAADKRRGALQLCTTPDMVRFGPSWIPTAIPVEPLLLQAKEARSQLPKGAVPIICQAPHNFVRKNTKQVAAAVKQLGERAQWRCVVKQRHPRCLALKAEAYIGIDQFRLGMGVNAYEFMAMGIPVVAHAEPESEKCIREAVGYLPYVDSKLKNLTGVLTRLLNEPGYWKKRAGIGLEYVRAFHARPIVVERYLEFCRSLG